MTNQLLTPLIYFIVALAISLAEAPRTLAPAETLDITSEPTRKTKRLADPFVAIAPPLPTTRPRGRRRGAIYCRFSTKFQASIEDQHRACQEWCDANDINVDDAMVFVDRAVSGKKSRRAGLEELKATLNANEIDVLVVFTTNRLHRNSYKARQFIEEETLENGARCVCIRSGVDTSDERKWRLLHSVNAIVDETMLTGTPDAVRSVHAGGLLLKLVIGHLPYGYSGKPIEGRLTRLQRPKREVIVDPVTSEWVKKVSRWYLDEDMSIIAIVERLGRESAPGKWTEQVVRKMLSNDRYLGYWAYGRTKTRWLNKKDYGLQEKQEQPLSQAYFPELRIIDDVTFRSAQVKLAGRNHRAGRTTKEGQRRPRILNGLLWCPLHDRP